MSDNRLTQTEVSLNPPSEKLVKIKINGVELQVPNGENIIEAAKSIGIDIPFFCYHPRLSKGDAANCRMCLVECASVGPDGSVRKMPKPQAACTMPASEGLIIETNTERVIKDRKAILEFLLINHPLDCPVCDRGGECPLQNNTLFYGPPTSRYIEEKRHYPKAYPLSDYVTFDRERCIQCARCTRFSEDISGDAQLGLLKRGADVEVGTFAQTSYKSKFSGNVIELCPVGALTSSKYRFKARPWDLMTQRSICTQCSNGCNIKLDYRTSSIQRVNARLNEEVNEEWTCDKGKFGHDYISDPARLKSPLLRKEGKFVEVSWTEAYRFLADKLKEAGSNIGGIGGARSSNEDNFLFQKLFRGALNSSNLDSRLNRFQGSSNNPLFDRFGYRGMGNSIEQLESMKTLFVLGSDLQDEQPILFLRVRKAWRFKNAKVVYANDHRVEDTTNLGDFAHANLVYRKGSEISLLNGILNSLFAQKLDKSIEGADLSKLKALTADWTPERTAKETGVSIEEIESTAKLISGESAAFIIGKTVTEDPRYLDILAALGNIATLTGNTGNVNVPGSAVNSQGAEDMGLLPDFAPGYRAVEKTGLNTDAMLKDASSGKLNALWIHEADLLEEYHDPALAKSALENCPFIVVNDLFLTETAKHADLVLPVSSVAEKDGTFTSCERRVQRFYKAFELDPNIKPAWLVFSEMATQLGSRDTYFSSRDILKEIASEIPTYAEITPKSLGESGIRWNETAGETKSPVLKLPATAPTAQKAGKA